MNRIDKEKIVQKGTGGLLNILDVLQDWKYCQAVEGTVERGNDRERQREKLHWSYLDPK